MRMTDFPPQQGSQFCHRVILGCGEIVPIGKLSVDARNNAGSGVRGRSKFRLVIA